MAEFSKGKQLTMHYGSSHLRHAQVPNSDAVVPQTQPDATESRYGSEVGDNHLLTEADRSLLQRTAVTTPGKVTKSLQPVSAGPQAVCIVRPESAPTVPEFNFLAIKRSMNKEPPREDALQAQPSTHPDMAVPSVERVDGGAPSQREFAVAE